MARDVPRFKALAYARNALREMTRRHVSPVPDNYRTWYVYSSGERPDLSRLLRVLDARGETFTEELCHQLHERFFSSEERAQAIMLTCRQIEESMTRVLGRFEEAATDVSAYGDHLRTFHDRLDSSSEIKEIRTLVAGVLRETGSMQERVHSLEETLDSSRRDIAALHESLAIAEHKARTDGLTRLANRAAFDEMLRVAASGSRAEGRPLSLLIADVDHFKAFNDRHGHRVGDQVLRAVADVLIESIKGRDLAARLGGEEFAILLPDTPLEGARAVAEQIRKRIAASRVRVRATGVEVDAITVSIGVAEYDAEQTTDDLVERADGALYSAKIAGRNRVAYRVLNPGVRHDQDGPAGRHRP